VSDESWKGQPGRDPEETSVDQELKDLLRAEPFRSFIVVRSSGDRYEVTDPFGVALGRSTIYVLRKGGGGAFIRKNQIVAVDFEESLSD
jgi:hypothetical protein